MVAVFLAVFRLTRHHKKIRQKIKVPLVIVFLLLKFRCFVLLGVQFPKMVEQYFKAVLYLSIAVLLIRIAVMLLFDFWREQNDIEFQNWLKKLQKFFCMALLRLQSFKRH